MYSRRLLILCLFLFHFVTSGCIYTLYFIDKDSNAEKKWRRITPEEYRKLQKEQTPRKSNPLDMNGD
ncbi:hypothetical protein CH363_09800 [Leptospira haakeii]|uniref:Lipoprotein n=1 Tax=Leptospira haakeii TaxID=2023198 RepID=A0ABX4PKV0_9LEPT|nr:hypothetical protein CH363_09800 [Leptospira haakeii]PKA19717.1 hypothetical protein CH377_10045 [Leptospira haakeii]